MLERIPMENWASHEGHLARYRYTARHVHPGETVNDVACGIGYGATFLTHTAYRGYDRPGVPAGFPGEFHGVDLDDPSWAPAPADVTVCFETLEHVADPGRLASVLTASTRRAVFVSVPVVPTAHDNCYHLHDFTVGDIPRLFGGLAVADEWDQPEELSHVWRFERP